MACHLNVHHQIKNKGNTLTLSPPLWITSQDHRRPMPINPKNSTVVKGLIALKKDWKKNLISAFSKAFKKPFTQEIILLSSFTFTAPTFPIKTRQLYFSSSSICSETLSLPTHFELATARESFDSPKRETENETKLAESVRSKGENPLAEYNFWACFKAGFLPPPSPLEAEVGNSDLHVYWMLLRGVPYAPFIPRGIPFWRAFISFGRIPPIVRQNTLKIIQNES